MFNTFREIWIRLTPKDKKYLSLSLWIIATIGFLSIFVFPRLFAVAAPFRWMEFPASSGNVSTTINGISTPFIALASAILTFLAFWVQYQANIEQKRQFDTELAKRNEEDIAREQIWRIERFEDRFYELLKLHKANVDEMCIDNSISGRKCFMSMFYELRYIYKYAERLLKNNPGLNPGNKSSFDFLSFTYKIFFYGIGPNSEKHFVHNFHKEEKDLYDAIKQHLRELQEKFRISRLNAPNADFYTFNTPISNQADDLTVSFNYYPFEGYIDRLAHYLRHLFQVGKYITTQTFIDETEKYNYIKVLRAQLSNFEQLMLYYNSLAWFKEEWRSLFVDYRLIKNLPLPLADFDIRPEDYFKTDIRRLWQEKQIHMFEWNE